MLSTFLSVLDVITNRFYKFGANNNTMSNKSIGKNKDCKTGWILAVVSAVCIFAFFELLFPYTLRHKEQTMIFIANSAWFDLHYQDLGLQKWIAIAGDFLMQFFYYPHIGPLTVSLLVTLVGVVVYRAARLFNAPIWIAALVSALAIGWECCRICGLEYPVSSTLQLLLWVMAIWCVARMLKSVCADRAREHGKSQIAKAALLGTIAICCIACGGVSLLPNAKWWNTPRHNIEELLAIDCNAYYGNWQEVETLAEPMMDYPIAHYYYNLAKAVQGRLADGLMDQPMTGTSRLFMPVNESGNYVNFTAAGEAWWAIGDMTTAEHATMLGMIFSPRHQASRNMKRLAQIAMRRNDEAGAQKYMRLLSQSMVHGGWTEKQSLNDYKPFTLSDTLSLTAEYPATLRNLLNNDKSNAVALDYLLCYDLLDHNLEGFTNDVQAYGCPLGHRLYEEAMLVVMQIRPEMRESWQKLVPETTYQDFMEFNRAFEATHGNAKAMYGKFRSTYWYYLQFQKEQ